ncbi:MAG: HAMP domain-containing histidine kinase [Spirochaetales bacterium]|nr:HAMP domain-containing histidine kinase [Spirochaetales bacterium]
MESVKKAPGWLKRHMRLTLIFLYVTVILVPGAVLGGLALRALDREEAYVEKTLQTTLLAEVTHTADTVRNELADVQDELRGTLDFHPSTRPYPAAPLTSDASPLVDTTFVLSPDKEILWPNESVNLTEKEAEFLYWNAPLMTDRVKVPVVKNIALEYKREIIDNPPETTIDIGAQSESLALTQAAEKKTVTAADESKDKAGGATAEAPSIQGYFDYASGKTEAAKSPAASEPDVAPALSEREAVRNRSPNAALSKQKASLEAEKENRAAINIFEQNKPIQEKIYKQAQEEGKEVLTRTTSVKGDTDQSLGNERSLFIVSSGTFSDIISSGEEGFLPRFLGDEFSLLYWRKRPSGSVTGCVVNLDALKARILQRLPAESTPARVLVVLDNEGKPLHAPEGLDLDWHAPFVAREIHETLPRWEAAAYLADPAYIASKAEATTSVLWVITFFLLVAIAGGGVIIIKMLLSELALAQKKTNLVTNVSHELKTPLTSIRLFAEMLKENVAPGPAKRREYCSLLLSETERLSRLINNVLDFSKMSQGKKQYDKKALDLTALCREVTACERIRLEKAGMQLAFSSNARKISFTGCRESLTRVLINLISNAEKYAGRDAGDGSIDVTLEKGRAGITLLVMDRGPGIPPWAEKKIFKEFFRVDDSLTAKTGGSGLGLTICKMIVNDHGGEIAWEPRPGGGSVFRIFFPASDAAHGIHRRSK